MSQPETKTKGMCIATRCASVEQFVQMFHRFVDEHSFFVSTLNTRPPGLETSFSVQLVDGTPVLRGLCVVQQAWTTTANPFKTPGVRLAIKRLTAQSNPVFQRLLQARNAAKQPPPKPQLAAVVVAKPGTPKPISRGPFSETAPAVSAPSRLELKQPARQISEPTRVDPPRAATSTPAEPTRVQPPRASTGDGIPQMVAGETTDLVEEKTGVREPKRPIVSLPGSLPSPITVPRSIPAPVAAPRALPRPTTPLDVNEVAKPLVPAEPVADASRTPGSELVLPANPLMNLSDESLEGYVDCTLYEETGNFFPADDDTAFPDDVAPPPANGEAVARDHAPPGDAAPIARGSAPAMASEPPRPTADVAPPVGNGVERVESGELSKLPLAPPPLDPTPPPMVASDVLAPMRRKYPPWVLVGGGAGVLVLLVLIIVITTSGGASRAPATAAAAKAPVKERPSEPAIEKKKQVVAAAPVPTPAAKVEAEPAEEPATDGPPTVGSGPCKVVVRSTPAGSMVKLDGTSVGPSPLTVAASCGKRKLDVVHPRYAPGSRVVTLSEGTTESLDVTLSRPTHVVTVTSQPSGAQVFIDGRSAGTTPTKLNVLGFVTQKFELKKTGYQPASVKHYSKLAQDKLAVRLVKW